MQRKQSGPILSLNQAEKIRYVAKNATFIERRVPLFVIGPARPVPRYFFSLQLL